MIAERIDDRLSTIFAGVRAEGWLHAVDLADDRQVRYRSDEVVHAASVAKVPILVALMLSVAAGEHQLDEPIHLPAAGRTPGPSGLSVMRHDAVLSLNDLAQLMIAVSDNHATDVVLGMVPPARVTGVMQDLGLARTALDTTIAETIAWARARQGNGQGAGMEPPRMVDLGAPAEEGHWRTTAEEMTRLLALIWRDRVATPELCAEMRRILGTQVRSLRISSGFGPEWRVAAKSGSTAGIRNEAGVVAHPDGSRYAVAVMLKSEDLAIHNPAADLAIGAAARAAVDHLRASRGVAAIRSEGPAPAVAGLPDTPAGARAGWLLGLRERGSGRLTDELAREVAERSAPAAREQSDVPAFVEQARILVERFGAVEVVGTQAPRPDGVVVGLRIADGSERRLTVGVEPEGEHRVTMLQVGPPPRGELVDWDTISEPDPAVTSRADEVPDELAAQFEETLVRTRAEGQLVGLLGALVERGRVVWFGGRGFASVAEGTPMTEHTVVRVGSVSKTMTAVAVMQLRDRGLLDLDRPVNEFLRSTRVTTRDGGPPVTVRHLLTHTAGLAVPRRPIFAPAGAPQVPLAEFYAGGLEAVDPGRQWRYSNNGFILLALVVEDVTGRPFGEHLRESVFDPLGMSHTDIERSARLAGPLPDPHVMDLGRLVRVRGGEAVVPGAGRVNTTTADMARYLGMLTGEEQTVLAPATLAEMMTPQASIPVESRRPGQGLGLAVEAGPPRVVGHNGGMPGANTAMWAAPDHGLGVLMFANTMPHLLPGLDEAATGLLRAACQAMG